MFKKLLPQTGNFFGHFERHAGLLGRAAAEFASIGPDRDGIAACAARIKEIETAADQVTRDCMGDLHATFITPIDRSEIHRLISGLDDVVDLIEATSQRMALYDIDVVPQPIVDGGAILAQCAQCIERAVTGLRDLKNSQAILGECLRLSQLEHDQDALHRATVAALFREEKNPIELIKWREIYGFLEDATDACEDVGNIIEGVVLENA